MEQPKRTSIQHFLDKERKIYICVDDYDIRIFHKDIGQLVEINTFDANVLPIQFQYTFNGNTIFKDGKFYRIRDLDK